MIKRDYSEIIQCACGCGKSRLRFDKWRTEHKYLKGHNHRGVPSKLRGVSRPPFSEETKRKIGLAGIGRAGAWTGKKRPDISGENHYNWKGGKTSIQEQIRKSYKYRQWRSDVFTRDDFTCVLCFTRGSRIEADHIKPFVFMLKFCQITSLEEALLCEELWNINNGRTLCVLCHRKTDTWGEKAKHYGK